MAFDIEGLSRYLIAVRAIVKKKVKWWCLKFYRREAFIQRNFWGIAKPPLDKAYYKIHDKACQQDIATLMFQTLYSRKKTLIKHYHKIW